MSPKRSPGFRSVTQLWRRLQICWYSKLGPRRVTSTQLGKMVEAGSRHDTSTRSINAENFIYSNRKIRRVSNNKYQRNWNGNLFSFCLYFLSAVFSLGTYMYSLVVYIEAQQKRGEKINENERIPAPLFDQGSILRLLNLPLQRQSCGSRQRFS
jgi:hypothetical protein